MKHVLQLFTGDSDNKYFVFIATGVLLLIFPLCRPLNAFTINCPDEIAPGSVAACSVSDCGDTVVLGVTG